MSIGPVAPSSVSGCPENSAYTQPNRKPDTMHSIVAYKVHDNKHDFYQRIHLFGYTSIAVS